MDYILDFEDMDGSSMDSYLSFIPETGISEEIFRIVSGLDPDDTKSLDTVRTSFPPTYLSIYEKQ